MQDDENGFQAASLPEQIAQKLRAEIGSGGKPGDRLPTVVELAGRFGVSKHSVANALELLARSGVITKRQGRGVFIAARPARRRLAILSELDLFDPRISPHFRAVASGLRAKIEAGGDEAVLYMGHAVPGEKADEPTCPAFWADAAAGKLDGAVVLNVPATGTWFNRLSAAPLPIVAPMIGYDVEIDFRGLIASALASLKAKGCRRVGLISWSDVEPFRRAVAGAGMETSDAWIRSGLDASLRGAGWEEFREIWSCPGPRPEGLIVLDDMLFSDAQLAILQARIEIPEELKLVVHVSRDVSPPVRVPATLMEIDPLDRAAAYHGLLLERMADRSLPPTVRYLPTTQKETDGLPMPRVSTMTGV